MNKKSLSRFKRHKDFLHLLSKCSPQMRMALLKNANKDQIVLIVEIIVNLMNGNLCITKTTKSKLCKHKKELRKLADLSCCLDTKQKIIQKGGGAFIAPIITSVLGSVIGSLINSINQKKNERASKE